MAFYETRASGSSSASGAGSGSASQKATKALLIENMNEAQIDDEIAKAKRDIKRSESAMGKNSITDTEEARAMREAFPLGYGGMTEKQIAKMGRTNERDAHKAKAYTEAYEAKKNAETRIKKLEETKKQVKGTGKTLKEINEEKMKKAVKSTPTTLKWKTTQKGGWSNGGYAPKIISAGDFQIHGSSGLFTVYKNGKQVGSVNKLSTAKALVERMNK